MGLVLHLLEERVREGGIGTTFIRRESVRGWDWYYIY